MANYIRLILWETPDDMAGTAAMSDAQIPANWLAKRKMHLSTWLCSYCTSANEPGQISKLQTHFCADGYINETQMTTKGLPGLLNIYAKQLIWHWGCKEMDWAQSSGTWMRHTPSTWICCWGRGQYIAPWQSKNWCLGAQQKVKWSFYMMFWHKQSGLLTSSRTKEPM